MIPMGMGALDELLDLPNMLGTGHFTSQERKRVLGQSGDSIFEKHYQAEFIQRDLQHVVLLRPPQEGFLQRAAGMSNCYWLFHGGWRATEMPGLYNAPVSS